MDKNLTAKLEHKFVIIQFNYDAQFIKQNQEKLQNTF